MARERRPALDLTRPRAWGELLSATFQLFSRHSEVFLTAALLLVTPVALLVDGVWGRALADGIKADPPIAAEAVSTGLRVFVILPLVTAMNVAIVNGLAHGATPSVRWALREAIRRAVPIVGAVILYVLGVAAGFVLLIVPAFWLAIRWYFAPQAVVIDGVGPADALRRSAGLVKGRWWRTAGLLIGTGFLFAMAGSVVIAILGSTGSGAVYVAGLIVVESAAVSLTAIFATLLFYDLRARRDLPLDAPGPLDENAPERPVGGSQ